MKSITIKRITTILLSSALILTAMPAFASTVGFMEAVNVYAASSVTGGTITSTESINSIKEKFDNKASVSRSGKTTTIKLSESIDLQNPITLQKADSLSEEHTIIIDLNGKTITGPGGKDAIIILSCSNFYVEIAGGGMVIGGEGAAVPVFNAIFRETSEGGCGVFFKNGIEDPEYYNYMSYNDLNCGLTISGGAKIVGGKGGSVTYKDWRDNFASNSDSDKHRIFAGNGGSGIGTDFYNIYAKCEILGGEVIGGEGGDITIGDNLITNYALMKLQSIKDYLSTNNHSIIPVFHCGNGGDGIRFYGGRKYINVATGSKVIGGDGGMVKYGNTGILVTRSVAGSDGDGGNGINLFGDIGLGGSKVNYSCDSSADNYWGTKYTSISSESSEMGMYIAGTVMGGSTKNCTVQGDGSVTGGDGIYLNLDSDYTDYGSDQYLGVIDVEGTVSGGNGGNGLRGNTGGGGTGIHEQGRGSGVTAFAKYYIVNGTVKGGKGGDSWTPYYSLDSTLRGNGGTGMSFTYIRAGDEENERAIRNIAGNGTISGGDSGSMLIDGNGSSGQPKGGEAIDTNESYYTDDIIKLTGQVANKTTEGKSSPIIKNTDYSKGVTVSIAINNTNLTSSLNAPNFNGKAFYTWTVTTFDSSGGSNNSWTFESSGTDYSHFSILRNADYSNALKSNIDAATVERIVKDLDMNNARAEIKCNVILEDGRCVQSSPITLPARWTGSGSYSGGESGGGSGGEDDPTQDDIDAESALYVTQLIDAIPATVTLDDADAVNEAWEAYEALNDNAKGKVWPSSVQKLQNAKARIEELEKETVDGILGQINELESTEDITGENAQAVKSKIDEIRRLIDALTPEEQAMLASSENAAALGKLDATEQKVTEVISGTATHTHLMQHVVAKEATCSTEGNIEHYKCMTCGEKYANAEGTGDVLTNVTTPTDSSKHKYGAWKNVKAPTCTAEGSKERVCEYNATHKETESIPIDPNAHSWDGGRVTKQPAVGVKGVRTFTCTRCGKTRTESIAALPQPYVAPPAPAEIQDLPYVKVSKPAKGKKAVTVKWKKVSKKNQKQIGGIEINVRGNGADIYTTAGRKKKSKKIKGLMPKSAYMVRVRAYNYIGGVKHVSAWSNWKTAKTK